MSTFYQESRKLLLIHSLCLRSDFGPEWLEVPVLPGVPEHLGLAPGDDQVVHVAARSQVVEDAGLDGFGRDVDGLLARQVVPVLGLQHGDGVERARAHGREGQVRVAA